VCGAIYVASFLCLAAILLHTFGFPLDDSWIHQVMARNLAETHRLGFQPGRLSAGSTSLLWTILLWIGNLVAPQHPVQYSFALSVLAFFGIGCGMRRIVDLAGLRGAIGWIVALAPAANGNLLWFGVLGMEHLVFLLLSIWIAVNWFDPAIKPSAATRIRIAALCALLVLTRPEGLFLLPLMFVFRRKAGRSLIDWVTASVGAALGLSLCAIENWILSHRLTPLTMQGRGGLASGRHIIPTAARFFKQSFSIFLKVWTATTTRSSGDHYLIPVVAVIAIAAMVCGIVFFLRQRATALLFLYAWAALILVLYSVILPITGHGGRYIAMAILLFLPLVAAGFYHALALAFRNDVFATAAVAVLLVLSAGWSITMWRKVAIADITQINTEHGAAARWMLDNVPADDLAQNRIAVFDIGRIGYDLHGHIIDLGGLVDSSFQPYLVQGRVADYLRLHDIRWVVLPAGEATGESGYGWILSLTPAHHALLTLQHAACSDPAMANLAFAATGTAAPCQHIYSFRYIEP
jgi:hypothetical protein